MGFPPSAPTHILVRHEFIFRYHLCEMSLIPFLLNTYSYVTPKPREDAGLNQTVRPLVCPSPTVERRHPLALRWRKREKEGEGSRARLSVGQAGVQAGTGMALNPRARASAEAECTFSYVEGLDIGGRGGKDREAESFARSVVGRGLVRVAAATRDAR